MVRKAWLFIFTFFVCSASQAQPKDFVRKGLLRASATVSQGLFFRNKVQPLYVHMNLDYQLERRVSFRCDINMLVAFQDDRKIFQHHHQALAGIAYHFSSKRFDPYMAVQPGVSLTKLNKTLLGEELPPGDEGLEVNPLISASGGFNYYIGNFMHVAVNSRFNFGSHKMTNENLPLNEFQFSVGLGWNLRFRQNNPV